MQKNQKKKLIFQSEESSADIIQRFQNQDKRKLRGQQTQLIQSQKQRKGKKSFTTFFEKFKNQNVQNGKVDLQQNDVCIPSQEDILVNSKCQDDTTAKDSKFSQFPLIQNQNNIRKNIIKLKKENEKQMSSLKLIKKFRHLLLYGYDEEDNYLENINEENQTENQSNSFSSRTNKSSYKSIQSLKANNKSTFFMPKSIKQQAKFNSERKNNNLSYQHIKQNVWRNFLNLKKVNEYDDVECRQHSLLTQILNEYQLLNQTPRKQAIIGCKQNYFNFKHQKIGSDHINSLPSILNFTRNQQVSWDFGNSGLNYNKMQILLNGIQCTPRNLLLSQNKMNYNGVFSLIKLLELPNQKQNILYFPKIYQYFSIRELNLEKTGLTNTQVQNLLTSILKHKELKILNLSKNKLDDNCGKIINQYLAKNESIAEFYLHWNIIQGKGGKKIFKGLQENKSISVFDISWNQLGVGKFKSKCAKNIGKLLKNPQKILAHLDISYNKFDYEDSIIIQNQIQNNKSLFGFHFEGNHGYVDNKGFLNVPKEMNIDKTIIIQPNRRINGVKSVKQNKYYSQISQYEDFCWICQGYKEYTFEYLYQPELGEFEQIPSQVFIHLNIENFAASLMDNNPLINPFLFTKRKMVRPGLINYFFTIDGVQTISRSHDIMQVENPFVKNVKLLEETIPEIFLPEMNMISVEQGEADIIHPEYYQPLIISKPRKLSHDDQAEWDIRKSIFIKFPQYNFTQTMILFLEKDLEKSKFLLIIPNVEEQKEIKQVLLNYYGCITSLYAHLKANNFNNFQIKQLKKIFLKEMKIVEENSQFKRNDFDLAIIAITEGDKQMQFQRHHLIEMFIRISLIYAKLNEEAIKIKLQQQQENELTEEQLKLISVSHWLNYLLDVKMLGHFKNIDSCKWRDARLFNKTCDKLISRYKIVFEMAFKKITEKKFGSEHCNFSEFIKALQIAQIIDLTFSEKDLLSSFLLSCNYYSMIQTLNIFSFIEACARIIEKISPIPYSFQNEDNEWKIQIRQKLPLYVKLEVLIFKLMKAFCSQQMIKAMKVTKDSIFKKEIQMILKKEQLEEEEKLNAFGLRVSSQKKKTLQIQMKIKEHEKAVMEQGADIQFILNKLSNLNTVPNKQN